MATRSASLSSNEKKFAAVVDRVLTDQKFAKDMQDDPASALATAGFRLTAAQKKALQEPKAATADINVEAAAWTRPLVRIVTRGTRPVVSVAVRTIVLPAAAKPRRGAKAPTKKRTSTKKR